MYITSRWFEISPRQICSRQPYRFLFDKPDTFVRASNAQVRHLHTPPWFGNHTTYSAEQVFWVCCFVWAERSRLRRRPRTCLRAHVDEALFGYDLLLGLNAIRQLGGMIMSATGEVKFPQRERLMCAAITLDEPDFHAEYDETKRVWTASWKWSGDQPPVSLKNTLSEYPAPKRLQGEYERELLAWIQNGWLIPYPESELGPPKGLIPLMAILQESKQKVRPVMDNRKLNEHVNAFVGQMHLEHSSLSAVTVRICMFVSSRTNLHTCTLPLAGSRSLLVKYARGSHIGFPFRTVLYIAHEGFSPKHYPLPCTCWVRHPPVVTWHQHLLYGLYMSILGLLVQLTPTHRLWESHCTSIQPPSPSTVFLRQCALLCGEISPQSRCQPVRMRNGISSERPLSPHPCFPGQGVRNPPVHAGRRTHYLPFSMPNSILMPWLYILTANSFPFFGKQFDVVHVHLAIDIFAIY